MIVTNKITDVTYEVELDHGQKRTFHVNEMKEWKSPVPAVFLSVDDVLEEDATVEEEKQNTNNLTYCQEQQLQELKEKFADVISDDPGRTDLVEHEIETEDASPIQLPPHRLPHAAHEYLWEEVKSLLTMGIIVPSKSPWAAPVVLVPTKVGSKRLCVDYRKLNLITRANPYPIPRVDLIDDIGREKSITALDLTKGYWQVPVAKSSQDKTAFLTPWGKYQFRTIPFGLVAAPSTFQRLMDMILEGTHSYAASYLGDVIVHSNTWDEHLAHLQEVFQRLRDAGLTIKEGKCKFACNKCTHLGHTVGQGQVHPLVAEVRAVQEYTQPKTKKDARAFLVVVRILSSIRTKFCNHHNTLD